jgi:hypothetical protein
MMSTGRGWEEHLKDKRDTWLEYANKDVSTREILTVGRESAFYSAKPIPLPGPLEQSIAVKPINIQIPHGFEHAAGGLPDPL